MNRRKDNTTSLRVSRQLFEAAKSDASVVLKSLDATIEGLNEEEVQRRLDQYGPNEVAQENGHNWLYRLMKMIINPLVILLSVLAILSFATDDFRAGIVISIMVLLGLVLRFLQESRADVAVTKLKTMISVTSTVLRDGQPKEVPLKELVPGDIIKLSAGDMVPADVRLITSKDLFIIQASLTGESLPVEKFDAVETRNIKSPLELSNICYLGTSIESGSATAVVVTSGRQTLLGVMATSLARSQIQTSFDRGISSFTWLMIQFMIVMVPIVFIVNGFTKHDWKEAFFFAMAVAVGLTPEMLPMIVTVCLSKGAISMSKKKVIVKRLHSIQNFGAMDVLCTDKTGTLTLDRVILEHHCDVFRKEDDDVLDEAYLVSHFQTGLKNVLDRAILEHKELHEELFVSKHQKIDEIPFDFSRKMMSVVVQTPEGTRRLLSKGAPEQIFKRCSHFEYQGKIYPMRQIYLDDLRIEYEQFSADGFRILAVAYRDVETKTSYSRDDEKDLVLRGYVGFLDPPKETAATAIAALQKHGVTVKVLTGDNDLVSRKICHEVGLPTEQILLGEQVETLSDEELAVAAEQTTLFARLSPSHKQRVIQALQSRKHVVGFLGDGINDAPALRVADVGISVDTAVDIARESADMILLEKSLMVLEEGVLEGRKVFANILKYIRMGASSNFGNMFSVLGASAFLPFLPMAPIQVLTNNLLYDFSQVPIPTDDVDSEQIAKPRPWSMGEIRRFILFIGPCSSVFDYVTYFIMLYIFNAWNKPSLFQTGWFVESLLTQTLIVHIIRTNRIPFIQSRASVPFILTTILIMIIGMWLPFSPFASSLGFTALPPLYWLLLFLTLTCYVLLTQSVKWWLIRKSSGNL
jgi:Mg2+-importing ATPase